MTVKQYLFVEYVNSTGCTGKIINRDKTNVQTKTLLMAMNIELNKQND